MKIKITLKLVLTIIFSFILSVLILVGFYYLFAYTRVNQLQKNYVIEKEEFLEGKNRDRIHFLKTGPSDCIIIESNGLFAMVDAAEDTDNPRQKTHLDFKGYEDEVVAYLKKIAGDENGKVVLEWVLGTHAHSDHIGGFDTIILHPDFEVKTAYLNIYDEKYMNAFEIKTWDNQEVYQQMYDASIEKGINLVQDLPEDTWAFGNFTVQFVNTRPIREGRVGENNNSVGALLTTREHKVFLAGDINNRKKREKGLADLIGEIDLLKVGHHGYFGSTSPAFVNKTSPKISIVTHDRPAFRVNVPSLLALVFKGSSIYTTGENNGIIADLSGDEIVLTNEIY